MGRERRPLDGRSRARVIAAIAGRNPPPISTIQPATPAALDRIIRTCLEKDPDARWQSASDIGKELEWVGQSTAESRLERQHRISQRTQWAIIGALAGLALGAALTRIIAPRAAAPAL